MPAKKKPGTAEMQLSEEQIRGLITWADETPGGATGEALHAKLKQMGVQCCQSAAFTFKRARIDPGLESLAAITAARKMATDVGVALTADIQDEFAQASSLMQQQAVFDWCLKHKRLGTIDLDDPEFQAAFIELNKVTSRGLLAKDRKALTDVRVKSLEARLEQVTKAAQALAEKVSGPAPETKADREAQRQQVLALVDEVMGIKPQPKATA